MPDEPVDNDNYLYKEEWGLGMETAAEDIPPTYLSGSDWVFVKGSVVTRYKLRKDKIKNKITKYSYSNLLTSDALAIQYCS